LELVEFLQRTLKEKLPKFLVNTLLLSRFHKHSFTPYPSLSGQVGISSIPSKNADRKITDLSGKHSFTLSFSNTLFYSISLSRPLLTDGQKNRQRDKYTRCAWAGGTFFQLCCCVSFLVVARNSFRCYLPTIPVVVLCHFLVAAGNSFGLHRSVFWLWRKIGLGVTYYLSIIPVVPLCQFFGCGWKQLLVAQFLRKILIRFLQ
jgi:hypothetical protein